MEKTIKIDLGEISTLDNIYNSILEKCLKLPSTSKREFETEMNLENMNKFHKLIDDKVMYKTLSEGIAPIEKDYTKVILSQGILLTVKLKT